jgi:hypothetical protein
MLVSFLTHFGAINPFIQHSPKHNFICVSDIVFILSDMFILICFSGVYFLLCFNGSTL